MPLRLQYPVDSSQCHFEIRYQSRQATATRAGTTKYGIPFSNKPTKANRKSKSLMDRLQILGMLVVYRVIANVFAKARECQPIVSPLDEAEYLIRR